MNKSKQSKYKIKFQVPSSPSKNKNLSSQSGIKKDHKRLWKIKKTTELHEKQIKRSVIFNIIKDELAYSKHQHQQWIKKQHKNPFQGVNTPIKKAKSTKLLLEAMNNKQADLIYNESILQLLIRSQKIKLCRQKDNSNPQIPQQMKALQYKNQGQKRGYRKTFHLKHLIQNNQPIFNCKIKKNIPSLPKLPQLPIKRQIYHKQIDYQFAPWQFKSSRQYFIKIKQNNQ